jgi:hypothetical protein
MDVGTIRFMVAQMPAEDRVRAGAAMEQAESEGRIRNGRWYGPKADEKPTAAEVALHEFLNLELTRKLRVFAATSTLRDQLDAPTVDSLFLLGQYLVFLNRPSLQYHAVRH